MEKGISTGAPTRDVYVYVNVFSITEISTTSETFNAYFYLRAMWVEPGLKSSGDFNPDVAWTPRFQFMNAVDAPDIHDERFEVSPWRFGPDDEPVLSWSCKCRGTFREQFELGLFPFDAQDLHLTISTQHEHVELHEDCYDDVKSKLREEYTMLPEFNVHSPPRLEARKEKALGKFATLDIVFNAQRRYTFHIWNVFLPVFLLTAMQFSVFAVEVADVADRLGVTLTLVLASVAYKYVVSEKLPNISYLTMCDFYVLGSFMFMAAVVCQNAAGGFVSQDDLDAAVDQDTMSQRAFIAVFVAGNLIYLCIVAWALGRRRTSGTGDVGREEQE